MHLKNYYNNNKTSALIYELEHHVKGLNRVPSYAVDARVLQLEPDVDASRVRYLEPPMMKSTIVRPFWHPTIPMRIIAGPCNGIYLLGGPKRGKGLDFSLWNPATGSLRELPLPRIGTDYVFSAKSYGFGVDDDNDFKVVIILHSFVRHPLWPIGRGVGVRTSPEYPSRVLVYSRGTHTWTELDELRHDVEIVPQQFTESYRFLNGFIFWLCVSPVAALAFDTGKDVFRLINDPVDVPEEMVRGYRFRKQLVTYKEDSLALFLNLTASSDMYDMWLLNQENWRWVKTCSVGPVVPRELRGFAVVGSCGGKLILIVNHCSGTGECSVVLFDLATDATKPIVYYLDSWPSGIFAYKDSLVSVGHRSVPVCRSISPRVLGPILNPRYRGPENDDPFIGLAYMDWDDHDLAAAFNQ
ncbi:hypothetical protein LINGRAHAP2_LOCUS12244 [Linum grandiflorum]